MSGRILLDTNIVIGLLAGEAGIRDRLAMAEEVFLSSIVLGELFYGAYKSTHIKENLSRLDELAAESLMLSCDLITARHYGMMKNQLRQQGRPIPENDIWIGAIAQQHDLTLITRDAHFQDIPELRIEIW
jgi:tRNA(fMet)-specific endonuclease VapC